MKRFLACLLGVAMLASVAEAQVVCLADAIDGDSVLDIDVGGIGAINLWMNIPIGLRIQSMDVALQGSDGTGGPENFQVIGFVPATPLPGGMQRTGRGAIEGNLPGSINDYMYIADDPSLPSATSGYEGTSLDILLDTIWFEGVEATPLNSDLLSIDFDGQTPQYHTVDALPPFPPPGGWEVNGPFEFQQNTDCSELQVNITPEPASLALLAFGSLAALRRRREYSVIPRMVACKHQPKESGATKH